MTLIDAEFRFYLRQAILNTARTRKNKKRSLWVVTRDLCGCGSTTATAICVSVGLEPDDCGEKKR